jgi:hypothetical protein
LSRFKYLSIPGFPTPVFLGEEGTRQLELRVQILVILAGSHGERLRMEDIARRGEHLQAFEDVDESELLAELRFLSQEKLIEKRDCNPDRWKSNNYTLLVLQSIKWPDPIKYVAHDGDAVSVWENRLEWARQRLPALRIQLEIMANEICVESHRLAQAHKPADTLGSDRLTKLCKEQDLLRRRLRLALIVLENAHSEDEAHLVALDM